MTDSTANSPINDSLNSAKPEGPPNRHGLQRFVPTALLGVAVGVFALALTSCDSSSTGSAPNQPPSASFTMKAAEDNPLKYSFDASGSIDTNTEGEIESYQWDFSTGETGTGKTVTHTFPEKGIYEVELTVVDDGGTEDTDKQSVSASARPVPSFTATPNETRPTQYTFDASGSNDPDGEIESYSWNFGDGTAGDGSVAEHKFNFEGDQSVNVSLTVVDDIGTAATTTKSISVDVPVFVPYPKASWEVSDFSSQMPGRDDKAAVLAIDGDRGTHWHTPWCCAEDEYGTSRPQPPHWIVIDMKEAKTVYGLEIVGRDGNYFNNPKQVTVKFADEYNGEDTNWSNAQSFSLPLDVDGDVIEARVFLDKIAEARYFRFTVSELVDNDILNLAELSAITTQEELQGD